MANEGPSYLPYLFCSPGSLSGPFCASPRALVVLSGSLLGALEVRMFEKSKVLKHGFQDLAFFYILRAHGVPTGGLWAASRLILVLFWHICCRPWHAKTCVFLMNGN